MQHSGSIGKCTMGLKKLQYSERNPHKNKHNLQKQKPKPNHQSITMTKYSRDRAQQQQQNTNTNNKQGFKDKWQSRVRAIQFKESRSGGWRQCTFPRGRTPPVVSRVLMEWMNTNTNIRITYWGHHLVTGMSSVKISSWWKTNANMVILFIWEKPQKNFECCPGHSLTVNH